MAVRMGRRRIGTDGPSLSSAAWVELVSHRYSIWPTVLGLHTSSGKGRGQ